MQKKVTPNYLALNWATGHGCVLLGIVAFEHEFSEVKLSAWREWRQAKISPQGRRGKTGAVQGNAAGIVKQCLHAIWVLFGTAIPDYITVVYTW